jgi:hypothetical protein
MTQMISNGILRNVYSATLWETECSVIQGAQRGEVLYAIILGAYGSELDGDRW